MLETARSVLGLGLPVSKKLWLNLALSFQKPVNFLETHGPAVGPASQFPRNWTGRKSSAEFPKAGF